MNLYMCMHTKGQHKTKHELCFSSVQVSEQKMEQKKSLKKKRKKEKGKIKHWETMRSK